MSDLNPKGQATVCLQGTALELTLLGQRINAYVIALDMAQFSPVCVCVGGGSHFALPHGVCECLDPITLPENCDVKAFELRPIL